MEKQKENSIKKLIKGISEKFSESRMVSQLRHRKHITRTWWGKGDNSTHKFGERKKWRSIYTC